MEFKKVNLYFRDPALGKLCGSSEVHIIQINFLYPIPLCDSMP